MGDSITSNPTNGGSSTVDAGTNSGTIDTTTIFNNITMAMGRPEFKTLLANILGLSSSAPNHQILGAWKQAFGVTACATCPSSSGGCQSPSSILAQYFGICPEIPESCLLTGTDCQSVAIANSVKYYFAQRDLLRYLLLQFSILCQALTTCTSNTSNTLRRVSQALRAVINQTCSYPLIIPNITVYCATVSGPPSTSPATGNGILAATATCGAPAFNASGTITINGTNFTFSNLAATSAADVAAAINSAVNPTTCGPYNCFVAVPVTIVQVTITGATGTSNLTLSMCCGGTTVTFTASGTTPSDLITSINTSPLSSCITASNPGVTNTITITSSTGLAFSIGTGPNNGYSASLLDANGNLIGAVTVAAESSSVYTFTGTVQMCAPFPFTIIPSIDSALIVTSPPTAITGLSTSYCPQYTTVNTFTCNGMSYLILEAPQLPINSILTAINNFLNGTATSEDIATLQLASCSLVNTIKTYLANVNNELLNLYALKRTLATFSLYCDEGTEDCFDFVVCCPSKCPPCPPAKKKCGCK